MRFLSARQCVFDAYSVSRDSVLAGSIEKAKLGADIQETAFPGQDNKIAHGLEAGQVISRVESLPVGLRSLVIYCFGPFTPGELEIDRAVVVFQLAQLIFESDLRVPGERTLSGSITSHAAQQVEMLCSAALHHHSETTWPYRRKGLSTPQAVREWISGHGWELEGRWTHGNRPAWCWVWDRCLSTLDDWEEKGLAPIAELVGEYRKATRKEIDPLSTPAT